MIDNTTLAVLYSLAKKQGGGGITEETDPTVSAWAKNPTKPSYTATEVGADAPNSETESW